MEPDEQSDNSALYSTQYVHVKQVEPVRPQCVKCAEMQTEINTLKKDRDELFAECSDKSATISDLQNRNAAICKKMSNMNIDSEVENILSHTSRKGREMFLIQWKNSWIPEENLNCPVKLKKYRRQN